ncbi:hypothetical protein ID866_9104 [Astraeus odoratus]|nr:hypothetical protein ID866_9104 [Astraeus odoratus]
MENLFRVQQQLLPSYFAMSTATIHQALPSQVSQTKTKAWSAYTTEDWELVLEASLDVNSGDDEATAILQDKVKNDCVKERTTERRWKQEEEEWKACKEAEQREQEEAEQKRKEEEAWRVEEARGGPCKWRRTQAKEDNGGDDNKDEDKEGDNSDFAVLAALVEEHQDTLGTLTMTLTCQVKGLKALQREMRKANALKVKEIEAITKGKEKAVEPLEELLKSGNEEEEIKGKGNEEGEVIKGKGGEVVEGVGGDEDVEMGMVPSASAT